MVEYLLSTNYIASLHRRGCRSLGRKRHECSISDKCFLSATKKWRKCTLYNVVLAVSVVETKTCRAAVSDILEE